MRITKRALGTQATMLALFLFCTGGLNAWTHDHGSENDDDNCQEIKLQTVAPENASGWAELCASKQGVSVMVHAKQLVPRNAYTLWLLYVAHPEDCVTPGCDGDFTGDNPQGVLGRMDSAVAKRRGRLLLTGSVRGMTVLPGSQVTLVLFTHGPARLDDSRYLARQLLTPQDPGLGPGMGVVADGPAGSPAAVAPFTGK